VTETYAAGHTKVVAFYSSADGAGRSCMVANVALILASRGYRVLIADLDLASPSLYCYLAAFLPVGDTPTKAPIRLSCEFRDPRGAVEFTGPTGDSTVQLADFTVRRADILNRGYDFVLIDTPAGPDSVPVTTELADVLVLGYSLNNQLMDKAKRYAAAIQHGKRGQDIQVLPVPMRVDLAAGGGTARMRAKGRRQFAWLLAGLDDDSRRHYWNSVEIPYAPDYAVEESLPFLDDSSDQRDRLVSAYAALAAVLAPGPSRARNAAVTDQSRARYCAARLAAAGGNTPLTVVHAAADRYWAEWLEAELRRMGLAASRMRADRMDARRYQSGSVLLLVSKRLLALPGIEELLAPLAAGRSPGDHVPLAVTVDGSRLFGARFETLGYLDLAGRNARSTRDELASYYQASQGSDVSLRSQRYYPGRKEGLRTSLPARLGVCRGRDDILDRIRDHFTSPAGDNPMTLTGVPGIGKSELALEYASRFAAAYDLVYLVSADSVHAVQAGFAGLAALTNLARLGGDAGLAALRELESGLTDERWLLIYDGADDPAVLDGYLPRSGRGHVLVTSRDSLAGSSAQIPVAALDPRDADTLLLDLVPEIPPGVARDLAAALNAVPLALRLAAAWIRVVVDRLLTSGATPGTATANAVEEFRDQLGYGAAGTAPAEPPPDSLRVTASLLIELLRGDQHGPAAAFLLETCAFLAPIGLSQRLLRSPGMLAQLTKVDPAMADPVVLHNVLQVLVTYGFSPLGETPRAPLRIHPLVLKVLRDQMAPERHAERAATVTRMLAASAPLDIDDDVIGFANVYTELQQHLEPSGAPRQTEYSVRRWLVNQVRFLWQKETVSAWRTATELGERLADFWAVTLPDKDDDTLLLRLRTQLANVYRSQCRFGRAHALDRDVLYRQRRVLGVRHLRTLMTARSYGADLRLVGDFQGALLEDQSTWQAFARTLGDNHLMTIIASSNLALSELLYGEPEQALERQQADIVRCRRVLSERPTQLAWIQLHVGTVLRELGRYEESRAALSDAQVDFEDLVAGGVLAPTVWAVLRTAAGLAITERRLGRPSLAATERTLAACRDTYGDLYPDLLALYLSRAGALHAEGRHDEAVGQVGEAVRGYTSVFGAGHPFTRLSQIDQSIYALAAGETGIADAASEAGLLALEEALGFRHLWSLAAAVARANVLAETGRLEEARALEERTLAEYRRRVGQNHPFTRIAGKNAAITRLLLNEAKGADGSGTEIQRRQAIELDAPPY